MVFTIFQWFSYGVHNFSMVFLWFPMVFTIFQYGFHNFPMVFLWFPMVFTIFQYGFHNFPMVFLWFPMVFTIFQWFSYCVHHFPMVFLWFPMVFTIFQWFSYGFHNFPMVFLWFWASILGAFRLHFWASILGVFQLHFWASILGVFRLHFWASVLGKLFWPSNQNPDHPTTPQGAPCTLEDGRHGEKRWSGQPRKLALQHSHWLSPLSANDPKLLHGCPEAYKRRTWSSSAVASTFLPDVASDADVNPDTHRLLNFHRQIGITEPQCPVPVGPQPDAISDPCQNLFINVPAVRSPVIFMQQSASRALVPTVIGDLLRTVPVWQLLAVVPLAEGHFTAWWCPWRGHFTDTPRRRWSVPTASAMVSYGFQHFPMVFLWFSQFSYGFPMVSYGFHHFPMVFLSFSQFSYSFPMVFTIFLRFSYGVHNFPMVFTIFQWFSYGVHNFPMVFLWFPMVFTIFQWFSYGLPMVFISLGCPVK